MRVINATIVTYVKYTAKFDVLSSGRDYYERVKSRFRKQVPPTAYGVRRDRFRGARAAVFRTATV